MGLYLVRQKNEILKGPMSLAELKSKVSCLEITTGDEVTGNLGPWVFMDSSDLTVLYPEISTLLQDQKDWVDENPTLLSQKFQYDSLAVEKNRAWKVLALSMVVGLIALGGLIYKEDKKFKAKMSETNDIKASNVFMSNDKLVDSVIEKFNDDDKAGVYKLLNRVNFAHELKRQTNLFYRLLPYARYVYFSEYIPAKSLVKQIPLSQLVGYVGSDVPKKCHATSWHALFKKIDSELSLDQANFMSISKIYPNLNVFLWNSGWVRSRKASGWEFPFNIHHACLIGANVALSANKSEKFDFLKERVDVQLNLIESNTDPSQPNYSYNTISSGVLNILNCVEATGDRRCVSKAAGSSLVMSYVDRQWKIQDAHQAILTDDVPSMSYTIERQDPYTKLDYRAESSFIEWYQQGGDAIKAKKRMQLEFPYLDF